MHRLIPICLLLAAQVQPTDPRGLGADDPASLVESREIVEHWPDGTVRLRYEADEAGRKHGSYLEYAADGTLLVRANYRGDRLHGLESRWYESGRRRATVNWADGELHGRCERFAPDGARTFTGSYARGALSGKVVEVVPGTGGAAREIQARYEKGLLDGAVVASEGSKVIAKQRWREGTIVELDGIVPHPRALPDVTAMVMAIERAPDGEDPATPAGERAAALRRLQQYRWLCGVPHEGMSLVEEWNEACVAAAEVCAALGRLSHTPERPAGMDEERYRLGALGAQNSNLAMGDGLVASVDSYMDDSDESNIDRVGHRRWCLNPTMRRTGFGSVGRFSAMWAMDSSGAQPKGMRHVSYPPAGFVPVDGFGPRHAWSVAFLAGGVARLEDVVVTVQELDERYLPRGEPLALDHLGLGASGYGTGECLIFRPVGLRVAAGARYRCRISVDAGRSVSFDQLVEFTDLAGSAPLK